MKIWNKLSVVAQFYTISFFHLAICWGILGLIGVEFINIVFFLTSYVWHFALVTPGLKEKVMGSHHKLSFLAVIVRVNHYLQIFINIKKLPYQASFIRALSPVLFTLILFLVGGSGNVLFTLIGSACFELVYVVSKNKIGHGPEVVSSSPLEHKENLDTEPAIQNAENFHE